MNSEHKAASLWKYLNQIDWVALTSIILLIIFALTFYTTYLFPVYPDEIQVRFWLSRLPYDFPEKISGAPTCLATFFQPIPATMYWPGLIEWVIHGRLGNPIALRQVGLFIAFAWVASLSIYLYAKTKQNLIQKDSSRSRVVLALYMSGLIVALFSVGVFPFFLVTNRAEQLILPSVALLVAIFLVNNDLDAQCSRWKIFGLVALYFSATSLILYAHPKGLFLTPLFIIVGWKLFSSFRSRWPFIIAMSLLAVHVVQDISAFKYAFKCGELPQFEAMLKSFSFDPASLFYEPRYFFEQAYGSWLNFPKYLKQLGFQEQTDISYLVAQPLSKTAKVANIFIYLNVSVIFLALMIALPVQYYRKDVSAGQFITINLALLVLFICMLISATFNLPKNWYDAGYLYALLLITLIFFVAENHSDQLQKSDTRTILFYLGGVALLSQAVLIQRNLPEFINGYAGPSVSIAKYDSTSTLEDIVAASRSCNIDPEQSQKIVVDDYTYLYFQKTKWPMAITYIWAGNNDKSIRDFFAKVESDGLVVNCTPMLAPYMPFVNREGNICCIPKDKLKNLSSLP